MSTIDLHNYEAFLLDYSEGNLNKKDTARLHAFILDHPELEIDLGGGTLPYLTEEKHSIDFKNSLKKESSEIPGEELLNYLEGNLSAEQNLNFENKLLHDKDLAKDLELYKKTILIADQPEQASFKPALYKTEDEFIFNNKVIAYLENQLSLPEKTEFEKELSSTNELKTELSNYSKTILTADLALVYPGKEALKKKNRVIALFSLRTLGSMAAAILLLFGLAVVFKYNTSKTGINNSLAKSTPVKIKQETTLKDSSQLAVSKKNTPVTASPESRPAAHFQVAKKRAVAKNHGENTVKENSNDPEKSNKEMAAAMATNKESIKPEVKAELPETKNKEVALAPKSKNREDSTLNKQNYLLVAEEITEGDDLLDPKNTIEKGFWKRAVQLAKQANKLGVKSVDGEKDSKNKYRLSFNSFSVEKK